MSEENEEIQKLLRLKRYERPPEGYFEDFLSEFQSRQRSELLKRSAHGLFFERLATYFSQFTRPQLAGAATAACAAVVLAVMMIGGGPAPITPEITKVNPGQPVGEVAETDTPRTTDFVGPVSFKFEEDINQMPNPVGAFVSSTEGPFSDLYILHPSGLSSGSALFREF